MTLYDIIEFLDTEQERQTLTEATIRRCVLLVYDMGRVAGTAERRPTDTEGTPCSAPCVPREGGYDDIAG